MMMTTIRPIFLTAFSLTVVVMMTVHSAPTTSLKSGDDDDDSSSSKVVEKPLIRIKRAEEIMYGNHQNAPRLKKSDPAIAAAPTTNDEQRQMKDDDNDNVLSKEMAKNESDEEGDAKNKEMTIAHDKELDPSEEKEEEKNTNVGSVENVLGETEENEEQKTNDVGGAKEEEEEEEEAQRKKRSIKTALMTAENMAAAGSRRSDLDIAGSKSIRTKRDLDYEDIRELIEESQERPSYEEEEVGLPSLRDPSYEEENAGEEEEEDEGPSEEELALPYNEYVELPRYEVVVPSERQELLRELVERKIEEDAKEKLLDYLLAAAVASESEEEREEGLGLAPSISDVYEQEQEQEEEEDEPRDLLLPSRGVLKRNTFNPYSYEPYGGRWGAMVPGTKRSSNNNDYERLYRLAQALNADEEDE